MPNVRCTVRAFLFHLATVVIFSVPNWAFAANLDEIGDHVLGQANLTSNSSNQGGAIAPGTLFFPNHIAVDRRNGRIWVADTGNHRVLSYPSAAAMANGSLADFVLGQPDFTSGTANNGGISASSLNQPFSVALDAAGNVFVSDAGNNRVLKYIQPLTTDAVADVVFGQPNFTSGGSGTTQSTLYLPEGIALDGNGTLYVAEYSNNRVVGFFPPFTNGMNAFTVLGQPDFVTATQLNPPTIQSLASPQDLAFDSNNNLYVADFANNRVLKYLANFSLHASASVVYGQGGSFITNSANNGGFASALNLHAPRGVSLDPFNNLYITDNGNNRIVQYNAGDNSVANRVYGQPDYAMTAINTGGVSATSLNGPYGSFSDNAGNLLICDSGNHRVLEYDLPLVAAAPTATLLFPAVMVTGSSNSTLYVSGTNFISTSVVQINGSPRPTNFLGLGTLSVALTAADVANESLSAITVTTPAPGGGTTAVLPLSTYSRIPNDTLADRIFGQPDFASATAGAGGISAHSFSGPSDVAVDATGRLWVCDATNHRVLSWAGAAALNDGKDADFVLGQSSFVFRVSGISATALFQPYGVAVDAAGMSLLPTRATTGS